MHAPAEMHVGVCECVSTNVCVSVSSRGQAYSAAGEGLIAMMGGEGLSALGPSLEVSWGSLGFPSLLQAASGREISAGL